MKGKLMQGSACIGLVLVVLGAGMRTSAEESAPKAARLHQDMAQTQIRPFGWETTPAGVIYKDEAGNMLTGLQAIGTDIYYFQENGVVYTGWTTLADRTFYFDETGKMQRRECLIDGKLYQFLETGDFITGWYTRNDQTYYRDEYGYDQTGMVKVDGGLYYIDHNGLQTGTFQVEQTTYYTDETGKICTGDCLIGGRPSHFTETGEYLWGWRFVEDAFYYQDEAGVGYTGMQSVDGKQYYFDEQGRLAVNTVVGMYQADAQGNLTRMPITVENLDAALDEVLQQTGNDIAAIGNYVKSSLRYKYMDRLSTREEMAVYALNNKRCSCYYYEALTGLLLERAGYQVITINGKGFVYAEHYWCLAYTTRNGVTGWYHVDALKGQYVKTDAEMVAKGFEWDHAGFPATP